MKVLVLVTNSTFYPSNTIVPFLKLTWGKDQRIDTIYYQGGAEKVNFEYPILKLDVPSSFEHVNEKGLKAFEWILENYEFDVLFRCTTTSYLNINELLNFIQNVPKENLFCGLVDTYPAYDVPDNQKIKFVSGAGCFFSRDVLEKLIKNKNLYDYSLNDDVAISKLLIKDLKIPITIGKRQDFYYGLPKKEGIDLENYHFRFNLRDTYYPRFLEVLSLLSIHLEYKKNVSSKKYVFFSLVLRFISLTLFEILRIINPRFISDNFKKLFNKLLKIFINIIKSNSIIYDISKKIKKWFI